LADKATISNYANEFLQAILTKYPDSTYWLTTHVWRGENVINQSLAPYLKPETQKLLGRVKTAEWGDYKTDGIDFTQPFLWFDDDLYPEERMVLENYGALANLVQIDLHQDPSQLQGYLEDLPKSVAPIQPNI